MLSREEVWQRVEERNLFICENCMLEEEACKNCEKLSDPDDIFEMLCENEYDERKASGNV